MPRRPQPRYEANRNQWILKFQGRRRFLCSGAENYPKALREAAAIMGGAVADVVEVRTVAALVEAWLAVYGDEDGWYRHQLRPWCMFAGAEALARLPEDHLKRYRVWLGKCRYVPRAYWPAGKRPATSGTPRCVGPEARPYSLRSIRAMVTAAYGVLVWGHGQRNRQGQRLVENVPIRPRVAKEQPRPRDYSAADLAALFAELPKQARPAVEFALEVGGRPDEVCGLKWADVRKYRRQAVQADHKTAAATGDVRRLPLTARALEIVEAQPREGEYVFVSRTGRRYTPAGLRSIVRRAAKRAGLDLGTVYGLRHSRAQSILDAGYRLEDVAAFLGHRSVTTAAGYAQVRADRVQELTQSLASPLPRPLPAEVTAGPAPAPEARPSRPAGRKAKRTG